MFGPFDNLGLDCSDWRWGHCGGLTGIVTIKMVATFIAFAIVIIGFLVYVRKSTIPAGGYEDAGNPDMETSNQEVPATVGESVTTPLLQNSPQGKIKSSVTRVSISIPRGARVSQDLIRSYSFSPTQSNQLHHVPSINGDIVNSTQNSASKPIQFTHAQTLGIPTSKSAPTVSGALGDNEDESD